MIEKQFFTYFLIILVTAYPASAGDVTSLNRWVLNVTLTDTGAVEEVIQTELENTGSSPLDGFSFVVPASKVIISSGDIASIPATGQEVSQQPVSDGIRININFNTPVEVGKKWDGRISLKAENWAVKEGSSYSVDIPVKAPQAIVGGKNIDFTIPAEAEIRGQVFLPEGVTATAVEPSIDAASKKPAYKKLLQFDHVVLTWFQLHIGDVIHVKGSFSDVLKQIVVTDKKSRELSARIKAAKAQGRDVSEAETHLANATDYNNDHALNAFWEKKDSDALRLVGYANDELKLAENSLSAPGKTEVPLETAESKKTPAVGAAGLLLILLISFVVKKKK